MQRQRLRHPSALRTLRKCGSSHCGGNAASGAGGATGCATGKRKPNTRADVGLAEEPPVYCLKVAGGVQPAVLSDIRRSVSGSGGSGLTHVAAKLAQRVRFDLTDSLSGHAIFVRQLVQRGLIVSHPALLQDVAAAVVQTTQRIL
jgi:hypothetical protein